jgi:hypothetical protein|tara:strand:+ start:231 stop:386 length:156 start_codon:yes stop_codon:yes gene_type:complete
MKPWDLAIILAISVHWGFSFGAMLAFKTDWSIPRFIMIVILFRYFLMSYGY